MGYFSEIAIMEATTSRLALAARLVSICQQLISRSGILLLVKRALIMRKGIDVLIDVECALDDILRIIILRFLIPQIIGANHCKHGFLISRSYMVLASVSRQ